MPPDVIRTMPFGTGAILLRTTRPIVADLRAWTSRADAKTLQADRAEVESLLRQTI